MAINSDEGRVSTGATRSVSDKCSDMIRVGTVLDAGRTLLKNAAKCSVSVLSRFTGELSGFVPYMGFVLSLSMLNVSSVCVWASATN